MCRPTASACPDETYQRGNGGEEIPGTMTESVAAKNGDDVTLTIDRDVQWYVKKVLHSP